MTYAEQLELESDKARQDLAQSLEELRGRISPGQVIDQIVEYAQDGAGAEFVGNLKRQAINNPLPGTLIGTGIAWLMLSGGAKPRVPSYDSQTRSLADRAGDALDNFGQSLSDAGASAKAGASGVSDTVARFRDRASGLAASTYRSASDTFDSVSEHAANTSAAVADSAKTLGQGAAETSRLLMQFCREQPFVLAGLGVALGAALGAMLPATNAESRLLGESSDAVKESIKDAAADAYDKAVAVGEHALEAAKDEARNQGLTGAEDNAASVTPATAETSPLPQWEEGVQERGKSAKSDG